MSARLFLGHLSPRAQEKDIKDFFRGFGKLRDIVIKNGFAFVELEDPRDAEDAVRQLDGKNMCDSRTTVEFAGQRGGSRGGSGGGFSNSRDRSFGGSGGFSNSRDRSFGGGYRETNRNFGGDKRDRSPVLSRYRYRVVINNLTTRVDWQELKEVFADCNPVFADAHKKERNVGIVCFDTQRDLKRAMEKHQGEDLNGRAIELIDDTQPSRSRSPARRGRSRSISPVKSGRKRSYSHSKSPRGSLVKDGVRKRSYSRSKSPRGSKVKSGGRERSYSRSASRSKSSCGSSVKDGARKRSYSRSGSRSSPAKAPRSLSPSKSVGRKRSRSHSADHSKSVKSPRGSRMNVRKRSQSRSSDRSISEKSPGGSPINAKRMRSLSRSRSSERGRRSHFEGSGGGRDRRRA